MGRFHTFWGGFPQNLVNYITKHHMARHHFTMRLICLHICQVFEKVAQKPQPHLLRGCVETGGILKSQSNPEYKIRLRNMAVILILTILSCDLVSQPTSK